MAWRICRNDRNIENLIDELSSNVPIHRITVDRITNMGLLKNLFSVLEKNQFDFILEFLRTPITRDTINPLVNVLQKSGICHFGIAYTTLQIQDWRILIDALKTSNLNKFTIGLTVFPNELADMVGNLLKDNTTITKVDFSFLTPRGLITVVNSLWRNVSVCRALLRESRFNVMSNDDLNHILERNHEIWRWLPRVYRHDYKTVQKLITQGIHEGTEHYVDIPQAVAKFIVTFLL